MLRRDAGGGVTRRTLCQVVTLRAPCGSAGKQLASARVGFGALLSRELLVEERELVTEVSCDMATSRLLLWAHTSPARSRGSMVGLDSGGPAVMELDVKPCSLDR